MCRSTNVSSDTARDEGAFAVANPRLGVLHTTDVGARGLVDTTRLDARAETRLVAIVDQVVDDGVEVEEDTRSALAVHSLVNM